MHHKKVLELALLVRALCRPHSMVKSNDHLFRSDRAHQIYSQLSTYKCYVNSKWENNCLLHYRKNILKMDIWKSFHHFSCAINSHIYIYIYSHIHTHPHTPHIPTDTTHTHIEETWKQNFLNHLKYFIFYWLFEPIC